VRLADTTDKQIAALVEHLAPYYYNWLENEEAVNTNTANQDQHFFCIDPFSTDQPWRQQLDIYKKYLLYFPKFAFPDPLASFLWLHITFATITPNREFRRNLRSALLLLAHLAPAVDNKDVSIIPVVFASDYKSVQLSVNKELEYIESSGKSDYYEPLYNIAPRYKTDEGGVHMVVEEVELLGQICARLQLTPVAGNGFIYEILKQDYKRGTRNFSIATNSTHRVTETLLKYDVPGVKKATLNSIISLRKNEDAFHEWRREFGKILDKAQEELPIDQKQFDAEFREAAESFLTPRVEELEKVAASSTLEKILFPAALAIGAGAAAFYTVGLSEFPPTAITMPLLTPIAWVLEKARRRFNKTGRKAALLREVYGYLLEKGK